MCQRLPRVVQLRLDSFMFSGAICPREIINNNNNNKTILVNGGYFPREARQAWRISQKLYSDPKSQASDTGSMPNWKHSASLI